MKRAVLYARVSGDDSGNDGRNLNGQVDMCREHAEAEGWQIIAELAEDDRGASGASFELPQLNKALDLAAAGAFDVLVIREIDRLSRRLAKQLVVEEEFKRCGVQIEYVLGDYDDTPEGSLMKNVRAVIAEYEREKINERMMRGRRNAVKDGHVVVHGNPPYGYKLTEVDGKRALVVDEETAPIVRLVYQLYVNERLTLKHIANKLTDMRAPTAADLRPSLSKTRGYGEWGRTTVHKILVNETYAGVWHYGKTGPGKKPNPREYWLSLEVPAIVDRELWEAAQEQRKRNKLVIKRNTACKHLLRSLVYCNRCSYHMTSAAARYKDKYYTYYCCVSANDKNNTVRQCNVKPYKASVADAVVWDWVRNTLSNPEAFEQGFNNYLGETERVAGPIRERLDTLDDLLAEHRAQLERTLDLYIRGDFPAEMLTERRQRLENAIRKLEDERLEQMEQLKTKAITDEQISTLREFVREAAKGLKVAEGDFDVRRDIIELLNLVARLITDDNGDRFVHVECAIGEAVLSLLSPNTRIGISENRFTIYNKI